MTTSTRATQDTSTTSTLAAQVAAISIATQCDKMLVSFSAAGAKGSAGSEKLTGEANMTNGTTSEQSVSSTVKILPADFSQCRRALEAWAKAPITGPATKKPNTGRAPVYSISMADGLFDKQYAEMVARADQIKWGNHGLNQLIMGHGEIQPDPDKTKTYKCYGGWDNFKAECLKLLGQEAYENPGVFPYKDVDEFLAEFEFNYDAELADPAEGQAYLTQFALDLLKDSRIGMASKMFTHALHQVQDAMALAIEKIDAAAPAERYWEMQIKSKDDKPATKPRHHSMCNCDDEDPQDEDALLLMEENCPYHSSLNVPTKAQPTVTMAVRVKYSDVTTDKTASTDVMLDTHDGGGFHGFAPTKAKDGQPAPIVQFKGKGNEKDDRKSFEGLARKIASKYYPNREFRFRMKKNADGSELQSSTFNFLNAQAEQTKGFFAATENIDFEVLRTILTRFYKICSRAVQVADDKVNYEARLRLLRTKMVETIDDIDSILS